MITRLAWCLLGPYPALVTTFPFPSWVTRGSSVPPTLLGRGSLPPHLCHVICNLVAQDPCSAPAHGPWGRRANAPGPSHQPAPLRGRGRGGESPAEAEHPPLVKSPGGGAARLEDRRGPPRRFGVIGLLLYPPLHPSLQQRDTPASPLGNSGVQRARRPGVLSGAGMTVPLHPAGFRAVQPPHEGRRPGGKERAALLVTARVSDAHARATLR